MGSIDFRSLGIDGGLLQALGDLGYETPTAIQSQTIPLLLQGENVLATAQTGTGKTAAFGLPLLAQLQPGQQYPQMLILTPTRELALQVAAALQSFAKHLSGLRILPVYGGQPLQPQLKALRQGVEVVVGTPGRILDHMHRGSLKLQALQAVVLDEADEMLRMGFIEDVETILASRSAACQCALFSATMPPAIRKVAGTYLDAVCEVQTASRTSTVEQIDQYCLRVQGRQKFAALSRILEAEACQGTLVFARTKTATSEVAEQLQGAGYAAAAVNGDLSQQVREATLQRLKQGHLDIVVATDVAARGLDVDRISHVINYDIPEDTEAYIHRIGRTGRAGRQGKAILFVTPQETRQLKGIEQATGQRLKPMQAPTGEQISARRLAGFKQQLQETMQQQDLQPWQELLQDVAEETEQDITELAAALVYNAQKAKPLFPELPPLQTPAEGGPKQGRRPAVSQAGTPASAAGMQRYRLEVGREQNITPKDIVGAFTHQGGLPRNAIGRIELYSDYATVELSQDLPSRLVKQLQEIRLRQHVTRMQLLAQPSSAPKSRRFKQPQSKKQRQAGGGSRRR